MIIEKGPSFNSKILLFGEYSLMKGSMALSIPNHKLSGQLLFEELNNNNSSKHYSVVYLLEYIDFLVKNNFENLIDIPSFKSDLKNGLYFDCNIPISYGLGSSGAIVASIYDAYAIKQSTKLDELKINFSKMESYYHGKSSGLDPLVSYLNKAILISDKGELKTVNLPKENKNSNLVIFLLDTKTVGETQPLVNWFLKEYENSSYKNKIQNELVPLNNKSITNFLSGSYISLLSDVKSISEFTFHNFKPMIPSSIEKIWNIGLETDSYYLKLCGSGGGGMMLGFTDDINKLQTLSLNFKISILFEF